MSDLLELLQNHGLSPRKISNSHGGEYACSCPVCGDGGKGKASDRFHVWPARDGGGKSVGRYWCRQCGMSGDTIAFLQTVDSMSFPQACAALGIHLPGGGMPQYSRYQQSPSLPTQQESWTPKTYQEPGTVWQQKAQDLLADCQARLLADERAMAWLAARGITGDMARSYGLGYNRSSKGKDRYRPLQPWGLPVVMKGHREKRLWLPQGWVIPAYNTAGRLIQLRIRRRDEDIQSFAGDIKYLPVTGSSMATMVFHPAAEIFVIVECGFDAVLLAALSAGRIGAVTTWNSAARPDVAAHALLRKASLILGGLDYDAGGDREQEWWGGQYHQYRRLPALPGAAKDPGDAAGDGADLLAWLLSGIPRGLQIKLGFTGRLTPACAPAPDSKPCPAASPQPENGADDESVEAGPAWIEVELAGGKVVYVTDDRASWKQLQHEGKTVFSANELRRLHVAMEAMDDEERVAAVRLAIDVKELFGGYIRSGRKAAGCVAQPAELAV